MILTISQIQILDQIKNGAKIYRTEEASIKGNKIKFFRRYKDEDVKIDGRIIKGLERHDLIKLKPSKNPVGEIVVLTAKGKKGGGSL